MSYPRDDWHKPRSHGQHLNNSEIARLRVAYHAGVTPSDIARELQCSSRIASKYYAMFRDGIVSNYVTRQDANIAPAKKVCVVSGCDAAPKNGARVCEKHQFKAPANLARLTGGRA